MGFKNFNPNPCKCLVGDCVVRAIAVAENKTWKEIYIDLCTQGLVMCDMPSSSGIFLLSGYVPTNPCGCCNDSADYFCMFGANIAIPTGGTVDPHFSCVGDRRFGNSIKYNDNNPCFC